jgi:hypothetical protein
MNKRVVQIALMLLTVCQMTLAQSVAKYAGEFLAIGVGGRALGLGGAYSALANDVTAGYWNPAALTRINYPEVMLMHDERFAGLLNYDYAAIAVPYGTNATLAISAIRLGVDGIPNTTHAGVDANGNPTTDPSSIVGLDESKISYFNSADWAIYASYAQRSSEKFSYGINLKFIRRTISDTSATGIGFDIGVLYSPIGNLYLAANAQDITTTLIAWSTGTNELISPTLKVGAAYTIDFLRGKVSPTTDIDIRFENRRFASVANLGPVSFDPHVGLEYDYKNTVAVRVGYSDVKQLTLGAGLHLRKIDLDYSYARFSADNDLGDTHRISLRVILQSPKFARASE